MSTKTTTKATVNPATEKKAKAEKPVKETKPTLDRQSIIKSVQEQFKSDTVVDIVADTTFQDEKTGMMRATNQPEYQYIHIFRKGTTKNCMQWYIMARGSIFVIGKGLIDLIPDSTDYAKVQHKKGYWEIHTPHANAGSTLAVLIDAYKRLQAMKAEAVQKKAEEIQAKKEEAKKAKEAEKAEKKAEAKKVEAKKPAKKVQKPAK